MNIIKINGQPFVGGCYWLDRSGSFGTFANARKYGRFHHAHWFDQTGFAPGRKEEVRGQPSLAAAVQRAIAMQSAGSADFWMALIEGDDGVFGLVKHRNGQTLIDGDSLYADRSEALAAFEEAKHHGYELYATPGLATDAETLDTEALVIEEPMRQTPVPLQFLRGWPLAMGAAAFVAFFVAASIVWSERAEIWAYFAPPPPEAPAPAPPPLVTTAIDSARFLAGCNQALDDFAPYMLAWKIERLTCMAQFEDKKFSALAPDLVGRPMLVVQWRFRGAGFEAMNRQLAERYLSKWPLSSIDNEGAWALHPLPPVVAVYDQQPPSFLTFRRAVDSVLGPSLTALRYQQGTGPRSWSLEATSPLPLSMLIEGVRQLPDLEIFEAQQDAKGDWRLVARMVEPKPLLQSTFEAQISERKADVPAN